jgi:hypothetical protein
MTPPAFPLGSEACAALRDKWIGCPAAQDQPGSQAVHVFARGSYSSRSATRRSRQHEAPLHGGGYEAIRIRKRIFVFQNRRPIERITRIWRGYAMVTGFQSHRRAGGCGNSDDVTTAKQATEGAGSMLQKARFNRIGARSA